MSSVKTFFKEEVYPFWIFMPMVIISNLGFVLGLWVGLIIAWVIILVGYGISGGYWLKRNPDVLNLLKERLRSLRS